MSEMESRWFVGEVIGKTTEQRGLLFKRPVYIIAIRIQNVNPPTIQFETEFDRYAGVKIGTSIRIKLYRTNQGMWAAPKEYVEQLNDEEL